MCCVDEDDEGDVAVRDRPLVPDSDVDDPPSSSLPPSVAPVIPPLDLYTLSQLLGGPTPPHGSRRGYAGAMLGVSMLVLVLLLVLVFGIGYVVLGAKLDTPTAWSWLTTAVLIFVVHAAIFDPLRILLVAGYWTVFRHQLMP